LMVILARDATPPEVEVSGVAHGGTYESGAVPDAACQTEAAVSGVGPAATLGTSGGPLGSVTLTCRGAVDVAGNVSPAVVATYTVTDPVINAAPVISSLLLPGAPIPLGTSVSLTAPFSDADAGDSHTAVIAWGDASTSAGTVGGSATAGTVGGSHTYATPGVYTITLTVTDDEMDSDVRQHQYVVVYDPTAGFVTGGGWIAYDATACEILCEGTAGRGEFGFVSRYKRGMSVPTGNTIFEFHAGTIAFTSSDYEWM